MTEPATSHIEEVPQPASDSWAEWVKDYYRHVESYDWVAVADRLRGPDTLFHRNRARAVRGLLARYAEGASRCWTRAAAPV